MAPLATACLLTQQQLVDGFFMEHRAQILDLAAYLDRLDRSVDRSGEGDFRLVALRRAMQVLCSEAPGRVEQILMILSDPVVEPMDSRDRQNAFGAFGGSPREAQP
jgi:hypothetical protein